MQQGFSWRVLVFITPALLIYGLFSAYPLLDTLHLGLYTADETGVRSFSGLGNYATILSDPQWSASFWNAMLNNIKFFGVHMLVQNPIGLVLAALLRDDADEAKTPTAAEHLDLRRCRQPAVRHHRHEFAAADLKVEHRHSCALTLRALDYIWGIGKTFAPIHLHSTRSVPGKAQTTAITVKAHPSKGGDAG